MIEEDRLDLVSKLRDQIKDEDDAVAMYNGMAWSADRLGLIAKGDVFRKIRADEAKHGGLLRAMLSEMERPIKPEEGQLQRPFPKNYGDWADLGVDIKEKAPELSDGVNSCLVSISEERANIDEAKRWLVLKAGELGIT
jgi:rubrerythrin